ncbi:MAG: MarR family transcriptional regulator [Methanospirillum sp.]|uniref:MarR family transcriptional regulator n=1 Tax=Methanospirillum sp. TaxID=45200 RepID=UPI00236B6354|nr:MarR family transcriptional regulator [Methanospirillum sp.]MDD1728555.1 MarR family transcriptional regulator [Methanospirillum sp.]
MPDNGILTAELHDIITRIIHRAVLIENIPVDLGLGDTISASEIHLIDTAGRFPGENLSSLAIRLGVTKGAVSQMVQKLEKKGYVNRIQEEGNRKNICLELTVKGNEAFLWHKTLHNRLSLELSLKTSRFSPEDLVAVTQILSIYEEMIAGSMDIRKDHLTWFWKMISHHEESTH